MRWLALVLLALIAALQYPMWLGKGGWLQVRTYDQQVAQQREANAKLAARNTALDADVRDLKTGYEAIEERARAELGMIRQDEVFFQLQRAGTLAPTAADAPSIDHGLPVGQAAHSTDGARSTDSAHATDGVLSTCSGSKAGATRVCATSRD